VNAALLSGRRKFYRLYVLEGGKREQAGGRRSPQILAEQRGVGVTMVPASNGAFMDKMSMGRPHNGYVLEASPLPQLPVVSLKPLSANPWKHELEIVLGRQSKEDEAINGTPTAISYKPHRQQQPLVLLLNEILDPANLGALVRSACFLGASAVAMTTQGSATLTAVALKASSGAAEEIPVFTVESAADFITASKKSGWRCYAAAPPTSKRDKRRVSIAEVGDQRPLKESPCILILGSEGKGLPGPLRQAADFEIAVPGSSSPVVDSLNVSVAGGILLNAFLNPIPTAKPAKASPQAVDSATRSEEEEQSTQTEAGQAAAEGEGKEDKSANESIF
jgi:21S rRNA (GM2251-2'-O)-methyltransferase